MSTINSVTLTTSYNGTDFTRKYKLDDLTTGSLSGIKDKILAVNGSLAGGTDGGLADFFVSDDFDGTNGKLKAISAATIESITETEINLQE